MPFIMYERDGTTAIMGLAPGITTEQGLQHVPEDAVNVRVVENPPPPTLDVRRAVQVAAIDAKADVVMEQGAPFAGKRIQVANGSRADLGGMALTASLAASNVVEWPQSYADGWIAIDNTRVLMPAPADGIALAYAAGVWYAQVRQKARTLKDMVLASDNPESIDITAGWPS